VYVHQPDRVTELHAMRIAAKRLRYTMEVFASLYEDNLKESLKAVKDAQEILGDIHDCDVWVQYLPQFLEEERARTLEYFGHARGAQRFTPGIVLLQENRQQVRNQRYEDFVKFWERSQDKNVWNSLRETMQMQVVEVIELGPPEADNSQEQPEIPSTPEPESTPGET
ncbi:MAG TPA: CHAD domain-containing protein, partial [Anaerolineae bacterium]